MKYDVIASGYVSMDHIIKIASPARIGCTSIITNPDCIETMYGGCGPNICVALSKLGRKAMPVIRVGKDWEQNGFKQFLLDSNVPTEGIELIEGEATSTCYLVQDVNGDHITIFYPGSMDKKYARPIDDKYFENTKLGVITVASNPDNRYFLDGCKKHGVPVVFGMKDDEDAFPKEFLKEVLEESTIIFTNEVEREAIESRFGNCILDLFETGKAQIIVTTLGSKGSICYEKTEEGIKEHKFPVLPVEEIVDATGSGDAYVSGFLLGYLEGREAAECCKLGTALANFVLQKVGCCTGIPDYDTLNKKAQELEEE